MSDSAVRGSDQSDQSDQTPPPDAREATDPHEPPDSGWLTDKAPRPRVTRRLAEDRISLPGQRTTVYSEEHGSDVQVDPWFAPDGTLRGGILILPDSSEIRAGPDVIEQLLGPDELYAARARLGLVHVEEEPTAPIAAL